MGHHDAPVKQFAQDQVKICDENISRSISACDEMGRLHGMQLYRLHKEWEKRSSQYSSKGLHLLDIGNAVQRYHQSPWRGWQLVANRSVLRIAPS